MARTFKGWATSERGRQAVLFFFLALFLSAFVAGHSLIVDVDFEACFGNMTLDGTRPNLLVAEMSFGQLASAAARTMATNHLFIAPFALLPLFPFWIAWIIARRRSAQRFWIACVIVSVITIAVLTIMSGVKGWHDCDRKGVSLGLLGIQFLYMTATTVATIALAALRALVLDREYG